MSTDVGSPVAGAASQKQLLETLTQRIRRLEHAHQGTFARRANSEGSLRVGEIRGEDRDDRGQNFRSTGIAALDQLLVDGRIPSGCLMEWLVPGVGAGADTLALWGAVRARRPDELLWVIDSRGDFYLPGGAPLGVEARTTVVLRPRESGEVFWALEQSLRTPGVGVVFCPCGGLPSPTLRRLQLAAEQGGNLGVLLRPAQVRGDPSFAEVRWGVETLPSRGKGARRWRVELQRARRQMTGGYVELELHDDEGRLRLVPAVAAAARDEEAA